MAVKRGFSTEANWYSRSLRAEMRIKAHEKICPFALAKHLEIPVYAMSSFMGDIPSAVEFFSSDEGCRMLSAVTIFLQNNKRVIIHNDAHDPKRQAANIAHEIAHALLLHPPKPPFDENGARDYSPELEEEANLLGPALLISEEAALWIARNGWPLEKASQIYGASEELVRMRLNLCGAYRRVNRGRAA
jgi:Zn-dependent peptidase ImmA (M78 family)